jgi:uncharacterized repeat protein (TIGR02543 family)
MNKALASIVLAFIFSASLAPIARAEETAPEGNSFDVVFVIDNSGSMDDSDHDKLSFMAAQLFIDLCSNSNSRMGYVGFSDRLKTKLPIQEISGNSNFRDSFSTLADYGGGTNIGLGLSEAYTLFSDVKKSEYGNKQVVILLGDGNNWPTQAKSVSELDAETKEAAAKLKDANITLYTIGFNYDGELNVDFMKSLPSDSNRFFEARTAEEIPIVMSQIYMSLFNGGYKHIGDFEPSGNTQSVNVALSSDMYEADVVFVASSAKISSVAATSPNGETFGAESLASGSKHSLLRLNFPDSGEWRIDYIASGDGTVAIELISIFDIPDYASVNVTFESSSGTVIYPQNVKYGALASAPPTPIRTGYIFSGWFVDEECETPFDFSTPATRDMTLYAKWAMEVAGVYQVTFDMSGGSFLNPIPVVANGRIELPSDNKLKRAGYVFEGFYLDKNATIPFDPDSAIAKDTTLYANWTAAKAKIWPILLLAAITLLLLAFALFVFPNLLYRYDTGQNQFIGAVLAVPLVILFCLTSYEWFIATLLPTVFYYTESSREAFGAEFEEVYANFFFYSGMLAPCVANLALVYVIPCLTPLDRSQRKMQYKAHLLLASAVGVILPLLLALPFGIDMKSALLLVLLHFVSWIANFFLSSLAVSAYAIKSFSLWG